MQERPREGSETELRRENAFLLEGLIVSGNWRRETSRRIEQCPLIGN